MRQPLLILDRQLLQLRYPSALDDSERINSFLMESKLDGEVILYPAKLPVSLSVI